MRWWLGVVIALLLLGFLWRGQAIAHHFARNVGLVYVNKALLPSAQPVARAQSRLQRAAMWLAWGTDSTLDDAVAMRVGDKADGARTSDMTNGIIREILRGEYFRQQGQLDVAAQHYWQAAQASSTESVLSTLLVPVTLPVMEDGTLQIDATSPHWRVRRDSPSATKIEITDEQQTLFSFVSSTGTRNRGSFSWFWPFAIPYHHTVMIHANVPAECQLIVETVVDGQLVRHVQHLGTDSWEEITFAVVGELFQYVYFHLDGIGEDIQQCQMLLDAVHLRPDFAGELHSIP
jgi:hypothetical protein